MSTNETGSIELDSTLLCRAVPSSEIQQTSYSPQNLYTFMLAEKIHDPNYTNITNFPVGIPYL
jgi:hypothetical protein